MRYKVIKPCRLGRVYAAEEVVDDTVVDSRAAGRLVRMGYLEALPEARKKATPKALLKAAPKNKE